MTTLQTTTSIEELRNQVKQANTATLEGRQIVVNACKELFEIVSETLLENYGWDAEKDAYNDLLNGDFAAPYMCELKKGKFELYYRIFTQECN